MSIERIESESDPRIVDYLGVRDRDLKGRADIFMAEGRGVVRVLLESPYPTRSLFLSESVLANMPELTIGGALADSGAVTQVGVPRPGPRIFVAEQALMSRVAGFPIHRGCLAIGERGPARDAEALLRDAAEDARVVVMLGVNNHDNVGAIFRSAAGFGAHAVLLDKESCDPFYRKALRVSTGATLLVPWAQRSTEAELLELLLAAGFHTVALTPAADAVDVRSLAAKRGRLALLLGAEGPGLSDAVLAGANTRAKIAMSGRIDSLNVGVAAGIAMHCLLGSAAG